MEVSPERLNASFEGLNVSSVGLCITQFEELRFIKLIRLSSEGLSVFSGGIVSNETRLTGATYVMPENLIFSLARRHDGSPT